MTHDNAKTTKESASVDRSALGVELIRAELLDRVKETARSINDRIRKVAGDTRLDLRAMSDSTQADTPPLSSDQ